VSEPRGVYALSPDHADAIRALSAEPDTASVLGVTGPLSSTDALAFIGERANERSGGRAYAFALVERGNVSGVCGLMNVLSAAPTVYVAIGRSHRSNGNATFAIHLVLEFAFENLKLERVSTIAPEGACRRLFERLGFSSSSDALMLNRQEWHETRSGRARTALHPSLVAIFNAELAAGNELVEFRTGWPDADSVFVRLRQPFQTRHTNLPADVRYAELNDPHWWKAEYSSEAPRHILASS
jgi:RimJ/RimL family protein N-acetyltransferase